MAYLNSKTTKIICIYKKRLVGLTPHPEWRTSKVRKKNQCGNVIELQYVKFQLSSFTCKFASICVLLVAMIANIIHNGRTNVH